MATFAGIRVSPIRGDRLLHLVRSALEDRRPLRVTFLNPDYARRALMNGELLRDINSFDEVLVDGNGVRVLTPLFGFLVPERLDTDSIAPHLFEKLARRHGSAFLFGCAPGVAEAAREVLVSTFPGLSIAGTLHGYHDVQRGHPGRFSAADSAEFVDLINASRADLLVVSLPTPLQQRWVRQYEPSLDVPIILTAGSYLDHVAEGGVRGWYPRWVNLLRLNWLYRLAKEPRRLWRRYTIEYGHLTLLVLARRFGVAGSG